jgi:prophage maintenance system killer protein
VHLDVALRDETVWLSVEQLASLFQRDRSVIQRHITNIYMEQELLKEATCANFAQVQMEGRREITRQIPHYNLDVIISVGYRVKSREGTQFRIWANRILKEYLLRGYALNQKRLNQLKVSVEVLKRAGERLNSSQVLNVISAYTAALDLLDDYDRQRVEKPSGREATQSLTYQECRAIIDDMRFGAESNLFGNEKDDSFHGILAAIEQTFGGQPLYPTLEEKAANLLYFIVKDHSFSDGNKRIAAAIFLHYLHKNNALFSGERKRIADDTLVALIIMLAESKPREKETMVNLVMQFLQEPIVQEAHEHA